VPCALLDQIDQQHREHEQAPTLGEAFDLHLSRMRADRASASSIATITRARDNYLADWSTDRAM
jgi:hypothetical protein